MKPPETPNAVSIQLKPHRVAKERRLRKRVDIRENEGVSGDLLHHGKIYHVRVWDLSTIGVSILAPESLQLKPKDVKWLRLTLIGKQTAVSEYEVAWVGEPRNGHQKVGLRIYTDPDDEITPENAPDMLWVSQSFPVSGYIHNDMHYEERSIFRLVALSSARILLDVLDQEHLFFYQQQVDMHFLLRSGSREALTGKIMRVLNIGKESVRLFIEFEGEALTKSLERDLIGHLVHDQGVTLDKIRRAGFKVKKIASSFRFRFVKTQEEYEEVLKLRFQAYAAAGKLPEGASLASVVAPLDPISRILIALHGEKVVASVAMSFPESEDVVLDTERALKNGYEGKAPPKKEMIEIARLCTDPDYRGGDLLLRMFEHIYRVFANSGRKYLISSTDKKLWPIYKNLGFKKLGLAYAHPFLAGLMHDLILIDLSVPVTGAHIGFLRWRYLYRNMTDYVQRGQKLERKGFARLRYKVYLAASKLLDLIGL